MTKQKTHTPLPWVYNTQFNSIISIREMNHPLICSMVRTPDYEANAEFIVKACNSYYTTRRDTLLEVAGMCHEVGLITLAKKLERMAEEA